MKISGISVIIPAYNEEKFIINILDKVFDSLNNLDLKFEVIVVNDGSTDSTKFLLENYEGNQDNLKILHQNNCGKGSAVQLGIKESNLSHILIQDADLEYDPKDYFQLINSLQSSPNVYAVYGSRILGRIILHNSIFPFPGKHPKQGILPWIANVSISIVIFVLYGKLITDSLTAYKLYPKSLFSDINVRSKGFEADHEITAKIFKANKKIIEVPISYYPRSRSEGKKIGAMDLVKAFYVFLKLRF